MREFERREHESLIVNRNIKVEVLEVCGDQVRIAISAPDQNPPYREETILLSASELQLALQSR